MIVAETPCSRRPISKAMKMTLWKKYFGPRKAQAECYVCGETILQSNFEAGHNIARAKGGGDDLDNLRPVCKSCNGSIHTDVLEDYKARHFPEKKLHLATTPPQVNKIKKQRNPAPSSRTHEDKQAELEIKVGKYISTLGFKPISKNYGFAVCAERWDSWKGDEYIAVDINLDASVTASYVRDVMNKATKLRRTLNSVQVLVAYIGDLPKDVKSLANGSEPPIRFKKY